MSKTIHYLNLLVNTSMAASGDPDSEYFYLAGPMTHWPYFNFPRFHKTHAKLAACGYNIMAPGDLYDEATREAAMMSPNGEPGEAADAQPNGKTWTQCLGQDLIIVSLPNCIGGILLPGWHESKGALGETWVLDFLGKSLYEYEEEEDGTPALLEIERTKRLAQLHGRPRLVSNAGAVEVAADHRQPALV